MPFPSPGDLSDPGIEPGSPALQADSLPTEPSGKPKRGEGSELAEKGISTEEMLKRTLKSQDVDISVIQFINSHRQFEANAFYEKLRKSYNNKKSTLYKNIVTCDEVDCTNTVLTTLAALNLQILLYMNNVEDSKMFMAHTRFEEINQVLLNYSKTFDLVPCIKVLQIIKADLKAFEYISKNLTTN